MMAGALGASGSLVIFNSSGETGWKPMPFQSCINIRVFQQTVKPSLLLALGGRAEAVPYPQTIYEMACCHLIPVTQYLSAVLLLCRNPQTFHLAIQVAALEAEHFRGAAYVAVILVQFFEDVVAFIGRSRLVQCGTLAAGYATAAIAVHQRRQMFALEARSGGIHDHDAFDHIAQFAHVSRPGIARQDVDGVIGDFSWTPAIGRGKFFQKVASE